MTAKVYDIEWTIAILNDRFQRIIRHEDYQQFCHDHADFFDDTGWEKDLFRHSGVAEEFDKIKQRFGLSSTIHYSYVRDYDGINFLRFPIFAHPTAVQCEYQQETIDDVIVSSPLYDERVLRIVLDLSPIIPNKQLLDELREQIRSARAVSDIPSKADPSDKPILRRKYSNCELYLEIDLHSQFTMKQLLDEVEKLVVFIRHKQEKQRNRLPQNLLAYKAYDLRLNTYSLSNIALKLNLIPGDHQDTYNKRLNYRKKAVNKLISRAYELIYSDQYSLSKMGEKITNWLFMTGQYENSKTFGPALKEKLSPSGELTDTTYPPQIEPKRKKQAKEILSILSAHCDNCDYPLCGNQSSHLDYDTILKKIDNPKLACHKFNEAIKTIRLKE